MGRKRMNKKLRLNIPLHCTTLTPLDFLGLFYKLFFLLTPSSSNIPIMTSLSDSGLRPVDKLQGRARRRAPQKKIIPSSIDQKSSFFKQYHNSLSHYVEPRKIFNTIPFISPLNINNYFELNPFLSSSIISENQGKSNTEIGFFNFKNLKSNYENYPLEIMKSFPALITNFVSIPTFNQKLTKE
uniref:hypothetical protein n=1 Tax=Cephaleuros karstenii TaxID=1985640 RepID=UPI001EDF0146|nr:hypothetical protein MFR52_pgp059 [Cephaleuros karstenii]UIB39100.1 hypothetical protein [Cephaleuros karstenii]